MLSPADRSERTPALAIPTIRMSIEGERSSEQQLNMSSPDIPSLPMSDATSRKHNRPEAGHPQRLLRRRIACQRCRARKIKCDNVRPLCGSCVDSGRQCIYVDTGREELPYVSHNFISIVLLTTIGKFLSHHNL